MPHSRFEQCQRCNVVGNETLSVTVPTELPPSAFVCAPLKLPPPSSRSAFNFALSAAGSLMSGSASDRRRDTRYDSFLSFPLSQKLFDLGFLWARPADDVRGVVEEVYERLLSFGRGPSVFFDRSELTGDRYPDDLSKAMLQLRGGGFALILLTAEYLRREWCLAELHSFLQLHKLGKSTSRSSEAVVIRVVCLDTTMAIKSALGDAGVKAFVGEVGKFQWQSLEHEPSESTRALVVNQICGHVLGYWNENPSICLGRDMRSCVDYLRGFFVSRQQAVSVSSICLAFGFRADEWKTIDDAFTQALLQGKFTSSNALDELSRATPHVDAKKAVREFRRKWVSEGWEWSIDPAGENDICLMRFVEEARIVLENSSTSPRPEPVADLIPPLPPLAALLVEYRNVDVFRPHLPDWQRLSDNLEANAATSLDQLKAAILPVESGPWSKLRAMLERVSFFREAPDSSSSLRRVALTSINGEGGVGKTSTCKLLCADKDVRAHFSNGAIVWINVGKGATEETVKGELGKVVFNCGGERSAGLIGESRTIGAAVDIAFSFFEGHRILVVLDTVWATPGGVGDWAAELSRISTCTGSAVIMTTRFDSLSRSPGFHPVRLGRLDLESSGSPDWQIAENLFDKLLKAPPNEQLTDNYKKNRKKALKMSCGLPIGIKTFACLVQHRMQLGDSVGSVLEKIEKRAIGLADESVRNDLGVAIGHPGLFAAMEENLAFLDEQKGADVVSMALPERKDGNGKDVRLFRASYVDFAGRSLSSRYYALNMLPVSSTRISFPVLCRLWHLRDVEHVENVALLFVNGGLGRVENESLGQNRSTRLLCLHDLQYEFCAVMRDASTGAKDESSTVSPSIVDGHALLLSSCESLLEPEKDGDEIGMGWTSFCFPEAIDLPEQSLRQYLAENLFRHLCAAVAVMDADFVRRIICDILPDFRWLKGRLLGYGRASAVSDCGTVLAARIYGASYSDATPTGNTRLLTGGAEKSVRALQQCLMLIGDGLAAKNDGTLAGSLVQLSQSPVVSGEAKLDIGFFKKLTCSSESRVCGPWFKPITGCTLTRGLAVLVQAVVGGGGFVRSITALGVGAHFVTGSEDGAVRVHESEYLGAVLVLSGRTDAVNCVAVAKKAGVEDSFLLFSGGKDGMVCSWGIGLDHAKGSTESFIEKESVVVGNCVSSVMCLAVSEDGDLVTAGCRSGTIFILKRREGGAAPFGLVASFRCTVAEKESGWVAGVSVSRSGDFVVVGEQKGGVAFWSSGGSGSEGAVNRCCASAESDAELRQGSLSEDESSVIFVFNKPAGFEVWDVASGRRSPRVPLSDFNILTCATFFCGEDPFTEGSGARSVLFTGGVGESGRCSISLHSTSNAFEVLSVYPLASTPHSVCLTSFGGDKRILVGSEDGCVRMLDAGVPAASDGAEPYDEGARSLGSGSTDAVDVSELKEVSGVAVMPTGGLVVAGHEDGRFSLWRAESGELTRVFKNEIGWGWVTCVDISADERLAVSGHRNGVALVWDTSTWECRFALEGHSKAVVRPLVCATISADAKRIVTVDRGGELRIWDAEIGGAALSIIETELEFSKNASRGAISPGGGTFLWAARDDLGRWRGKVIDLDTGSVVSQSVEARPVAWNVFLKELMPSEAFDGEKEVPLRYSAVCWNQSVELRDVDPIHKSLEGWRISSGNERRNWSQFQNQRIDCALRSADGKMASAAASLGLDSDILSIAAGWVPGDAGGGPRAIVACVLRGRSFPAIMHFYPTKK